MSVNNQSLEQKLVELNQSKTALEDNLKAHQGAIQVLQQLLDEDKELVVPVETEDEAPR